MKLFEELFIDPPGWKFESSTPGKVYTVREGKKGLVCDCWGYIAHRKCKHIAEVKKNLSE